MQRILCFLLICGILGQASIRTAWTLHYQWNRAIYIAKCENRDKPALHCDGKCAFMKQMAARNNRDSKAPQLPENFSEIKDIQLFFEDHASFRLFIPDDQERMLLPPYRASLSQAVLPGVFRPPLA